MKLLAIDGNSLLNRAFYGIKLLTTKDGVPTNGIYGFLNILNRLIEQEAPDGVAVAFDLHAPTFRHQKYDAYKAGRRKTPDELLSQFEPLKEILTALGYTCLSLEGYEADDILGTLAARAEQDPAHTCVIATGDRDSLQLVSEQTTVLLSTTKMGRPEITACTPAYLAEKYGLTPAGMIELKALMGDASDNIPGVPGVGEKTATTLVTTYGTVDHIYEHLDELDITAGLREKLRAGEESARLSHFLGTICREVPLSVSFTDLKQGAGDPPRAAALLRNLEMFSLLPKFGLDTVTPADGAALQLDALTETDPDSFAAALLTSSVQGVLVQGDRYCFSCDTACVAVDRETAAAWLPLCSRLRAHDVKALYEQFPQAISRDKVVFDTMLAAYLLDPNAKNYAFPDLCDRYRLASGQTVAETMAAFGGLCDRLETALQETGMNDLFTDIELPLAEVLAGMERYGVAVDIPGVVAYGKELESRIEELRRAVIDEVGYEFNLNSPKQLGVALFETLELPYGKKTKNGYSTSAEVLENLKPYSTAVCNLLEYRGLTKLKSTYCEGLAAAVGEDGRIHSILNQTETRTGRLSSSEPNLQNIPVRKEEGRRLREYFRAEKGYVLCDADYSQIELRLLAAMANDPAMIQAFNSGEDIHAATAAEVFGMPRGMVTPAMRSKAKAVNFGIVYGIGAFSLSKDIGVSRAEADRYIKNYLTVYSGVDAYMKATIEDAKNKGYVSSLFGRRRPMPELSSSNGMLRAFGERAARNAPIQGTAADIMKIAMIRVWDRLKVELPEARLILQVHDELIVEAPEADADLACRILKEEMEGAARLAVRLTADVHTGKTWLEAKDG